MFSEYRRIMEAMGGSTSEYMRKVSENILRDTFQNSTSYKKVLVNGVAYDARIISDSKTTIRSGNGNYVIQFKPGIHFKSGTYVDILQYNFYARWMIIYEDDDPFLDKPIIKKCNYLLKWKNSRGEIIERDVVFSDNIRLTANVQDVQRGQGELPMQSKIVLLPLDAETLNIDKDMRFLIDVQHGLLNEPNAFSVVSRNITSKVHNANNYDGVVELAISESQFNPKTDNAELMIADYYKDASNLPNMGNDTPENRQTSIIYKGSSNLIMGMSYKEYSAIFTCNDVIDKSIIPIWEVVLDDMFAKNFDYKIENNKLYIKCNYSSLVINTHIVIKVHDKDNLYYAEKFIKVVSAI